GSVAEVLQKLIAGIKATGQQPNSKALTEWWGQIDAWRSTDCLRYNRKSDLIKPQYVIEKLYELTKGNAFVASDVGQHQMFAAQFYKFDKPRRWLSSGGLGTMGFGLPAAMGAQFAHPNDTVVCITGEGSIQMCIQELSTCKQFDLPIKIIMLNNGFLGMVRQWQEMFYGKRYSQSYVKALPDFVKLAESYGHVGMRVDKPSDVVDALQKCLAIKDRLVFMDFIIDPTENVYPMVAAGKGHNEMVLSPETESD
ncbi:MAG: acetolactate synthase 3 large subunit, partial [Thiomargarita sp.]|nr:acetolactate synthase 3 large subunit [Thiomargarita sp.]